MKSVLNKKGRDTWRDLEDNETSMWSRDKRYGGQRRAEGWAEAVKGVGRYEPPVMR